MGRNSDQAKPEQNDVKRLQADLRRINTNNKDRLARESQDRYDDRNAPSKKK
jgi:hypothetical protein